MTVRRPASAKASTPAKPTARPTAARTKGAPSGRNAGKQTAVSTKAKPPASAKAKAAKGRHTPGWVVYAVVDGGAEDRPSPNARVPMLTPRPMADRAMADAFSAGVEAAAVQLGLVAWVLVQESTAAAPRHHETGLAIEDDVVAGEEVETPASVRRTVHHAFAIDEEDEVSDDEDDEEGEAGEDGYFEEEEDLFRED